MGSSKTANAIMVQYNYGERHQKVLMVKPQLENRDGARIIRSRSGLETECVFAEELEGMDLTGYDCVIVDEAQFLTKAQVEYLVHIVDDLGILFHILIFGDNDIWVAGKDLLRLCSLCLGASHTAGRQSCKAIAISQHIGSGNRIKHLGALGKGGVVDVLHTAQQAHVADVGIHTQRTRTNADYSLIGARSNGHFTADHIGD